MTKKLFFQALTKFVVGLAIVMVLLFIPAGTLSFWQAWLFIGILFVPMLIVGIILMSRNPELLRKRLDAKEKEGEQKSVVAMSSLLFLAMFVIAGLNYRFGWWILHDGIVFAAAVLFLLGYIMYAEVMRENVWLSRTVEVQDNQKVVDTGLYGIVRHPMYSATLILFLTMPLVLASPWSFVIMLLYLPIVVKRIHNEETVLKQELGGYKEYIQRIRYRLIPFNLVTKTNNETYMKYVKLIFRLLLGLFMTYAGFSHLTFNRQEFVAQVPTWLQFSPTFTDFIVLASGVVEIAFGLGIIFLVAKKRAIAGALLALFYVAIFPGNINQYVNHIDAFGLNTDNLRLIRLFFQPVLIFLALWTTGGWKYWKLWAKGKLKE